MALLNSGIYWGGDGMPMCWFCMVVLLLAAVLWAWDVISQKAVGVVALILLGVLFYDALQ